MRRLAAFLVHSNVWIATGAAALALETSCLLGFEPVWPAAVQLFLATFMVYSLQRLVKVQTEKFPSDALVFAARHRKALLAAVLACAVGVAFVPVQITNSFVVLALLVGAFSVLYVAKIFSLQSQKVALREIPFAKLWTVTLVWAVATAVLPIVQFGTLSSESLSLILERWFFLVAITIPFDIRDLQVDPPHARTLPMLIGVSRAKKVTWVFFALALLVNFYRLHAGWLVPTQVLGLAGVYVIAILVTSKVTPQVNHLYCGFGLDATLILHATALLLSVG